MVVALHSRSVALPFLPEHNNNHHVALNSAHSMSASRQPPSASSSPSKSSLRRVSSPPTTQPRNLLPSPQFENTTPAHSPTSFHSRNEFENASSHAQSLPFQPFFSLIEDTTTHEHFHPTVHYIFADDDADIITEAACRSLTQENDSQAITSATESRYLPSERPGVKEHYLVLDIQPTHSGSNTNGLEVTHAQSLSSEWQVLRTSISQAPTIGESSEDEGLMLRIEGKGNTPPEEQQQGGKMVEKETIEELIAKFQKRLDDVRQVMQTSTVHHQDEREQ